jgi:hypothetical protein
VHPYRVICFTDKQPPLQVANTVQGTTKLSKFLSNVLPATIPHTPSSFSCPGHIKSREHLTKDVLEGVAKAPMSLRITPHTLSVIDWENPLQDPVWRQFVPLRSQLLPDHPMLTLDSLHEEKDSRLCPPSIHISSLTVLQLYQDSCIDIPIKYYSLVSQVPSTIALGRASPEPLRVRHFSPRALVYQQMLKTT